MDFSPSPRATELLDLVGTFVRDEIEPVAADYHRQVTEAAAGGSWAESPILGRAEGQGQGAGVVEPLPAGRALRALRREVRHPWRDRPDQRRLRPAGRADGPGDPPGAVRLQLPRARHGQHGGAAEVRHRRAEGAVARAPARRPDPLGVHDDRAGCGLLRRHQHGGDGGRRRRRGRRQRHASGGRPGVGHPDCRILVFMGLRTLREGARRRPPPPAHDGARPGGHPRGEGRAAAVDDERPRRPGRPRRGQLRRRARAEGEHPPRRGPRVRDRAGPPRAGAGAPLHAADRAGRGRARARDPARPVSARRSASRWSTSAATASGSPTPGWPSTRRGCWSSTPPGSSTRAGPSTRSARSARSRWSCPTWPSRSSTWRCSCTAAAVSPSDFPLAAVWTSARSLRLADGPDEVHRGVVAKIELAKYR